MSMTERRNKNRGNKQIMAQTQGFIFDIQRSCTTDGPGIRTVVFFKGCNMRCFWCHNPESISTQVELEYNERDCINCGNCVEACPSHAHYFSENGLHHLDRSKCVLNMRCVEACDAGALRQVGRMYSVDQCFSEIAEDIPFYQRSGGGVTLSGGEPLLQAEFVKELLLRCRQAGIHTAIESNLSVPWKTIQSILPYVDLIMADIKHMDDQKHKEGTGVSHRKTLENIQKLEGQDVPLIIRTPVIPGFNDTAENMAQTAAFISQNRKLVYYELLSYNALGCEKAMRIGKSQEKLVPDRKKLSQLAGIAYEKISSVWIDGKKYNPQEGEKR